MSSKFKKSDAIVMQKAYKLLFEIETTLKQYALTALVSNYGEYWQLELYEPRGLETAYYHEIVSFYGKYPPLNLLFNQDERKNLTALTSIRNKIAHMHLLKEYEYTMLKEAHDLVVSRIPKY